MALFLLILLNASIVALVCGCIASQEVCIESDYSYSDNFRRYRTSDFLRNHGIFDRYRILTKGYVPSPEAAEAGGD